MTAEAGRRVFKQELTRNGGEQIEIICGEGPWEEREAAIGAIKKNPRHIFEPASGAAGFTGDKAFTLPGDRNTLNADPSVGAS